MRAECLVKTVGCYAGVFDAASPVNRPGAWADRMRSAHALAAADGQSWAALWRFNGEWFDAARRGEVLPLIVLFDGVYKARVEVVPADTGLLDGTDPPDNLGVGPQRATLVCPSGRIVVASLSDLGSPTAVPVLTVAPGTYRAVLQQDDAQVDAHAFLDDASAYPARDGPDWHVRLQVAEAAGPAGM